MQKNEKKFYSKVIEKKNNLLKIKNRKLTKNTVPKINNSRNKIIGLQSDTSSHFSIYKNYKFSICDSKENLSKNEKIFNNCINPTSNEKNNLINNVQLDVNYLKKISSKNIKNKSKILSSLTNDKDNNSNGLNSLNKTPIIKKKIDFIKNKFLLGQKNYFKRFNFRSSFNYKRIYPYLNKKPQKSYEEDKKLKKYFFEPDDINIQTMKEVKENVSILSIKNMKTICSRNYISKKSNFTRIKIKKFNFPSIIKKSNNLVFEYKQIKDNIKTISNNLAQKSKKNEENNKSIKKIDEKSNEYLSGISSSESNNSDRKMKHIYKIMKPKYNIKNIKILKHKVLSYDKRDIYKNIKRIVNHNSNININNNKMYNFRKIFSNGKKSLESINKIIVIENNVFKKKI